MKVSKILIWRAAALSALLLLVAVPAAAQRGKWWQNDRFVGELGLTQEQSTRLEEIFQKHQPTLRQRMEALEQAEKAFDTVVETGDDNAVMGQVDVVEAARAELNKARTLMLLRMRRSLTADQWAKFTALAQSTRDRDRGPRPSGTERNR
jgi:Spy/CpxP family protein refolding chaperone